MYTWGKIVFCWLDSSRWGITATLAKLFTYLQSKLLRFFLLFLCSVRTDILFWRPFMCGCLLVPTPPMILRSVARLKQRQNAERHRHTHMMAPIEMIDFHFPCPTWNLRTSSAGLELRVRVRGSINYHAEWMKMEEWKIVVTHLHGDSQFPLMVMQWSEGTFFLVCHSGSRVSLQSTLKWPLLWLFLRIIITSCVF